VGHFCATKTCLGRRYKVAGVFSDEARHGEQIFFNAWRHCLEIVAAKMVLVMEAWLIAFVLTIEFMVLLWPVLKLRHSRTGEESWSPGSQARR